MWQQWIKKADSTWLSAIIQINRWGDTPTSPTRATAARSVLCISGTAFNHNYIKTVRNVNILLTFLTKITYQTFFNVPLAIKLNVRLELST